MSDTQSGPDWWQASDGRWYPPEQRTDLPPPPPPQYGTPPARAMAGVAKFAQRMADYLNEPIDGACPITPPGGTVGQLVGVAVGAGVGSLVAPSLGGGPLTAGVVAGITVLLGALLGPAIGTRVKGNADDLHISRAGWVALSADHLTITRATAMGRPTGAPVLRVPAAEVSRAEVAEGKLTVSIQIELRDGRRIAFEAYKRAGLPVVDLLRSRLAT